MAYEISHFSCCRSPLPDLSAFSVLFLHVLFVNPSSRSSERISKGSLELFGVWNRTIRVRMVDQRIVLLDPPELCAPCTTVLWVLLVERASPMVPVRARCRLYNPQSGLSSCWSSSKLTRRAQAPPERARKFIFKSDRETTCARSRVSFCGEQETI